MKNGWKRWIRGWSLIVILLSVLSVSGCSVSEEDGLQEVTEKVSQEPEVSQKDSGKSEDQEKPGQTEGDTDTGSKKSAEKKIWVYVCGAVNAPGVYELKEDARLYEAIELAGGVNQEAAPEVLNQARVLADGERIYVPKQDEAESYSLQDQGLESNAGTADTRGKININTAGKEELMTLPGIGEAKAEKILRYREEHGAFRSIEDVMQIEGIKEGVFNKIKDIYGKIDILVNNAGISARESIYEYKEEDFKKIMDLNVNAVFNCSKAVSLIMKENKGGVILNTSSMVSIYGQPSGCGYPASKFAVNGLTKSLARELGKDGIRVNAVAPGIILTDMMKSVEDNVIEPLIKTIPLGRIGRSEDVANAFLFLASDMASYITGAILPVDGAARS